MSTRGLPHYWTPDQVKMVLDALPAAQPWLFGLMLWRTALRQAEALNLEWRDLQFASTQPSVTVRNGKGGRFRVVPVHPELVDAFRSVPHRLDFVQSGGVSKGVEHPAVYSARDFYQFRAGLRRGKIFLLRPDVSSDQTDGVGESRVGFGIPRR